MTEPECAKRLARLHRKLRAADDHRLRAVEALLDLPVGCDFNATAYPDGFQYHVWRDDPDTSTYPHGRTAVIERACDELNIFPKHTSPPTNIETITEALTRLREGKAVVIQRDHDKLTIFPKDAIPPIPEGSENAKTD
uniref:Uncharacterized protein n=1 Tax=viral metagenome TaxID=1070528 RepID=A0A6H1ZFV5_9ZZZZ